MDAELREQLHWTITGKNVNKALQLAALDPEVADQYIGADRLRPHVLIPP